MDAEDYEKNVDSQQNDTKDAHYHDDEKRNFIRRFVRRWRHC